jgi:predicted nucleic acid-binding protein
MILDTNAISALAGLDQTLARMVDADGNASLSFIAVAEYRYGILGSTKQIACQKTLDGLLEILPVLLPDLETLEIYAALSHELKRVGRTIPTNDLWIAALARQHAMPVLSRDQHFDRIPDIQRLQW